VALLIIGVCVGSVYALMALSVAVVYRGVQLVNFAQGEFGVIGVFVWLQWTVLGSGSQFAGIALGLLTAGACGLAFSILSRRMAAAGGDHLVPLIGSFGLAIAMSSLITAIWGAQEPYTIKSIFGNGSLGVSHELIPSSELGSLAVALVLGIVSYIVTRTTRIGLQLRATVANPDAAELLGIPTRRLQSLSWIVGTMLAGVAIFLYFENTGYVDESVINDMLIPSFAIAAVGGFENIPAIAIASVVYGVATEGLDRYASFAGRDIVSLGMLLGLLMIAPRGLLVGRSARYS
jgi:branched-chain amino acid transport system permease protein